MCSAILHTWRNSMATCIQCDNKLTPIVDYREETYQFDNALWIGFFGGYGMFVESPEYVHDDANTIPKELPVATHEAVLCHDCAHELTETIPWIKDLLNPYISHTHTEAYIAKNPDHEGIDHE